MKPKFIKQGTENGHDPKVLEKIWGDWEKFASYAFNKSHATCYSWVAYQTAYLKAHYPAEFMAGPDDAAMPQPHHGDHEAHGRVSGARAYSCPRPVTSTSRSQIGLWRQQEGRECASD